MKYLALLLSALLSLTFAFSACKNKADQVANQSTNSSVSTSVENPSYAMVIHGGAGTILKENMTEQSEAAYRKVLNEALAIGKDILAKGGTSQAAVVSTIMHMENSPLFNAGKGAVFTHEGNNEMDASIMHGQNREAGAVGGISTVKNPILAAEAVLDNSEHVLLVGKGAEKFAVLNGIESIDASYFKTERRWKSLQRILEQEKKENSNKTELSESKFGTVGAVALDKTGTIVAATSTGGMTNKRYNRIGDSPIIGAGTFADNKTCGISCTGHGEFFIRYAVAHDVSAMMEYKGVSLKEAADHIIHTKLKEAGGSGGLIGLDKDGNIVMPFNTPGMYRGYVTNKTQQIAIYGE